MPASKERRETGFKRVFSVWHRSKSVAAKASIGYRSLVPDRNGNEKLLEEIFLAQRELDDRLADLLDLEPRDLVPLLSKEVEKALKLTAGDESTLRLTLLAEVLGELEGPEVVGLLIRILGTADAGARREAGEALEALAYDRFKEVAVGVERHLAQAKKGDAALSELPYLLVGIPEPGVVKLLGLFLQHEDSDAVAAAIEALTEIGDPSAARLLQPLAGDKRTVEIEDASGISERVTVGVLASEALELLSKAGPNNG